MANIVAAMPSGVKLEPRDTVIDGVPGITFFGFDANAGQPRLPPQENVIPYSYWDELV